MGRVVQHFHIACSRRLGLQFVDCMSAMTQDQQSMTSRRLECSRTGTKHVPTRPAPTTKKLEALNYPVGMTRLDLILKITSADGKRKHEHRTVEIPDHPDALYHVFHVLRAWHRLWTECRLSGHNLLA